MGLKSGSRDAGLDDESDEPEDDEPENEQTRDLGGEDSQGDTANEPTDDGGNAPTDEAAEEPTDDGTISDRESSDATADRQSDDRPSVDSLPYVLRRDRVNEGRDQVPFFLREEVVEDERALRETLEAMLGEDVYKSDLREAAMIVAQEQPELVAEVLRRWGYDLS